MTAKALRRAAVVSVTGILAAFVGTAPAVAAVTVAETGADANSADSLLRATQGFSRDTLSGVADVLSQAANAGAPAGTVADTDGTGSDSGWGSGPGTGFGADAEPTEESEEESSVGAVAGAVLDATRGALDQAADAISEAANTGQ